MANPLWKDYYVTLGTDDGIIFRIVVGENTIYTGKSHIRPGETENRIRINDMVLYYEFVRKEDDAILRASADYDFLLAYAEGYTTARNSSFIVE